MNLTKIYSPTTTLSFHTAVYEMAPVYQLHIRRPDYSITFEHPMLPDQILLHTPLSKKTPKSIHTAANGRTGIKGCVFWAEWQPSHLKHVFYAFEKSEKTTYFLVFFQPVRSHLAPFRLLVVDVDDTFPKVPQLWEAISTIIAGLPPIE